MKPQDRPQGGSMRFLFAITMLFVVMAFIGCRLDETLKEIATTTTTTMKETIEERGPVAPISWEATDSSRKEWSKYAYGLASSEYFIRLLDAKDWNRFCTKFYSLSLEQRATLFVEWVSATSKYESSWNPKSFAVDVGKPDNKATWSTGLMQVSAADYQNRFGYDFEDLLTPKPNIHLAYEILAMQIKKTGLVILPNSNPNRYWAVLLEGNKYQKISQITAATQKLPFCN